MATAAVGTHRPQLALELEMLDSLPCGCVSGSYRVRPYNVSVVSLEAKGPYCILGHAPGQIVRLGDADETSLLDDDLDEWDLLQAARRP